jgi:hypothetical protein
MAKTPRKAAAASILAMLSGVLFLAPPAGAGVATTYQVQVGAPCSPCRRPGMLPQTGCASTRQT